jgi:hypothetical protein
VKAALFLVLAALAAAQTPHKIGFECGAEDMEAFGLTCTSQEPCDVFLELTGVEALGTRLLLIGNLHTSSVTLYSLLLVSEDDGQTWSEPHPRLKGALLDHVQFIDFEIGWINGHITYPIPRDPFLLISSDGGKSWKKQEIFDEGGAGVIEQFRFDSRRHGLMVIRKGRGNRQELWETNTGGTSWDVKEARSGKITIPQPPREAATWRIRAGQRTKTLDVERRTTSGWQTVASFDLKAGTCRPPEP